MHNVSISVPGEPVAKARARVTSRGAYTPKKTRDWEKRAKTESMIVMAGIKPFTGPVRLSVTLAFMIPDSWPKWKKEAAKNGQIHHTIKPDGDNCLKAIKDAMNGIVYLDDSQVTETITRKIYSQRPEVFARVTTINGHSAKIKKREDLS